MKLAKSILIPIRLTKTAAAVSLSFLRLRRTNTHSFKVARGCGGQDSTPTTASGEKRSRDGGAAFENTEPSSPKVTCIGQVRVKSARKKPKQSRSLSQIRRTVEVSFRKTESLRHKNQRWVHLPINRLGSCCCCRHQRENNKNKNADGNGGFGAVPGRWMILAGKRGRQPRSEFEVSVVGGDADVEEGIRVRNSRRHVFDDIEVKNGRVEVKGRSLEIVEDTCHPPKNALLVMRCRSDPTKMDSLVDCKYGYENHDDEKNSEEDDDVVFEKAIKVNEEHEIQNEIYEQTLINKDEEEEIESNMSSFEALLEEIPTIKETTEAHDVVFEKPNEKDEDEGVLPECLLLMMCEPKLSMEVSKETWVRSADFVGWLPERPRKTAKTAAVCDHRRVIKKGPSVDSKPKTSVLAPQSPRKSNDRRPMQPPRSSCSLPEAAVTTMISREMGTRETFALSRCKSEPMRTAAAAILMLSDDAAEVGR